MAIFLSTINTDVHGSFSLPLLITTSTQPENPKSVKLPSDEAITSFEQLAGVTLDNNQLRTLIDVFPAWWELIKLKRVGLKDAKHLLRLIRTTMKSATLMQVSLTSGFIFGRTVGTGGGKSLLLKAYSQNSGEYFAAKLFLDYDGPESGSNSSRLEFDTSQMLQPHHNIVHIKQRLPFRHATGSKEPLIALLMPLYSGSLAELISRGKILPVFFLKIAYGLLSAGARFQEKLLSHCDIKPANIMINGSEPVLIDFGAVVSLGQPVYERTPFYALNASVENVTPEFDLCCIVTTLVRCFIPGFELEQRTKSDMKTLIDAGNSDDMHYSTICSMILSCTSCQEAYEKLRSNRMTI